jgi:hypothetical protein
MRHLLLFLLLVATPAAAFPQELGSGVLELQPEPAPLESLPPAVPRSPLLSDVPPEGEIDLSREVLGPGVLTDLTECDPANTWPVPFGYNLRQSNTSWLVGNGDDFGMFSLESRPALPQRQVWGITSGIGFHFLGGPIQSDMPPRLFDFQIGFQRRKWVSPIFGYDVSINVGAFSDFEGSAREGVRYPGHAVGYYRWNPGLDFVLGIDYLDRDDISLLPVAGLILTPREELRLELVFPRPRAELRISPTQSVYLGGELGGGTWAVERITQTDDVATYRDLRLLFGIATRDEKGHSSAFEFGYVFARDLSYRSGSGDLELRDTVLFQLTNVY